MEEEDNVIQKMLERQQKKILQDIAWTINTIKEFELQNTQQTLNWMDKLNELSVTF